MDRLGVRARLARERGPALRRPRYGDDANRVPVPSYTVFDASLAWRATRDVDLALYARNLANRTYAASTSNGGAQWLLGPSRSAELVATLRF